MYVSFEDICCNTKLNMAIKVEVNISIDLNCLMILLKILLNA